MGYELRRFSSTDVDEELLCAICSNVLEDPIQTPCQHVFCRLCILDWLQKQSECPNDRFCLREKDLRPSPFILKNILNRLEMYCKYCTNGCNEKVPLEFIYKHERTCIYRLEKEEDTKSSISEANYCLSIKYIESLINDQNERIKKLERDLNKGLFRLQEYLDYCKKRQNLKLESRKIDLCLFSSSSS